MTAEGTFPKIGGDPLYYSEVNRFATGNLFFAGSSAWKSSGTGFQTMGSFYISGGLFKTPTTLYVNLQTSGNSNEFTIHNVVVSGVSTNGGTTMNNSNAIVLRWSEHLLTLGSPYSAYARAYGMNGVSTDQTSTDLRMSSATISNLDLNAPFVVFLNLGISAGSSYINHYAIGAQSVRTSLYN